MRRLHNSSRAIESAARMAALTEVRIVTGLRAASQCIAWIGAKTGAVAKHGLTATFPRLEVGAPRVPPAYCAATGIFAQIGTVPIAEAVLNGRDAVILLRNAASRDDIVIMASPEIATLDQLTGRKVGVLTHAG